MVVRRKITERGKWRTEGWTLELWQQCYLKYYTHLYFNTPLGDWVVMALCVCLCRTTLSGMCRRDNGASELVQTAVSELGVIPPPNTHTLAICEHQHMTEQIGLQYGGRQGGWSKHHNIISKKGRGWSRAWGGPGWGVYQGAGQGLSWSEVRPTVQWSNGSLVCAPKLSPCFLKTRYRN